MLQLMALRTSPWQGFDNGVESVWNKHATEPDKPGMLAIVKTLIAENAGRKLFVAGHSLGGALATVAAGRLAYETDLPIAGVYSIGSPR